MTSLPVPLEFSLPGPEWEAVPPESLGVHNAAFLAVRRRTEGDYTPTISISGDFRPDAATLLEIADESVQLLREQAQDVELVTRRETGSEAAPSVTQLMGATIQVDEHTYDLRQTQVLVSLLDKHEPSKRAVVILSCTATYQQFDTVAPEFQALVASVRPLSPDEGPQDGSGSEST